MAALDDRLVLADAFQPGLQPLLAHHGVKPDEKAGFERLERDLALVFGPAEVFPAFRRLVRRKHGAVVGQSMLGPIERYPAVLRIDASLVAVEDSPRRGCRVFRGKSADAPPLAANATKEN